VVEPVKLPEKSKGGIILTLEGSTQEKLDKAGRMIGVVLAVGPQCWKAHAANLLDVAATGDLTLASWASVGDTVLYARHAGKYCYDPLDEEDKQRELYLIHDDDVLAVLPPQDEWAVDYNDITV
jgi:co-chaperonin GroES (HSP10)